MVSNRIQKQSSKQYFVKPVQKQPYADVLKEMFLKISYGRFPVNIAQFLITAFYRKPPVAAFFQFDKVTF